MKKSLLALGAITAVAVPVVATVSCGLGNVLKNKIMSEREAERVIDKTLSELSDHGTYNNDMLYYQEYRVRNAGDNVYEGTGFTKESWKGITFNVKETGFWDGKKVWGFADWTGTHGFMWSATPVTLADGVTKADAVILYQYEKTHGTIWAGSRTSTAVWNGMAAIANAVTEWKHLIYGIALIPATDSSEKAEQAFNDAIRH